MPHHITPPQLWKILPITKPVAKGTPLVARNIVPTPRGLLVAQAATAIQVTRNVLIAPIARQASYLCNSQIRDGRRFSILACEGDRRNPVESSITANC